MDMRQSINTNKSENLKRKNPYQNDIENTNIRNAKNKK